MALVENDPRTAVRDAASVKNINNNYTNFVEPSDGGNSDFNFIYDLAGYEYQTGYKIKGAGLNITNLNTNNKVYYRTSYSNSVNGYNRFFLDAIESILSSFNLSAINSMLVNVLSVKGSGLILYCM